MIGRALAAIIALIAWLGLVVQFDATFAKMGTVPATLAAMSLYFTIIANLAVAIVFTRVAARSKPVSSVLLGGVTITILLVGIVYNVMLRGMVELSGGAETANLLNHDVTPVAVSLFWLFVAEKGHLGWRAPLQWTLPPLLYFPYGLARGALQGTYPYPFMNVEKRGWGYVVVTAGVIASCFALVGYAMVLLDRRSSREGRAG